MWWWQAIQPFLATWNYFQLRVVFTFRFIAASSLPEIIKSTCRKISSHSLHLWVARQYISLYYLLLSFYCDPDWAENICIYGAQADGDQWKQCTRVLQRDRLQSGWEWKRGWGQGGEGVCTQIANVWERADFYRREVRLNCSKSGVEVANTLSLKIQPA